MEAAHIPTGFPSAETNSRREAKRGRLAVCTTWDCSSQLGGREACSDVRFTLKTEKVHGGENVRLCQKLHRSNRADVTVSGAPATTDDYRPTYSGRYGTLVSGFV
jgi:hypothetical protein